MPAATAALSPEVLAKYQPVIGLEVHVQLLTRTKAFCGCKNEYGGDPNTHTCPTCLGLPGALPVLNRQAVEFAALAARAIGCTVNEISIFARKNYFYPDSPKGYQISQFDKPLAEHGHITVTDANGNPKPIGITRLHLEEDAGKSLHDGFADSASRTYIDLNRCGTPLIEIVSEPDIRTPDEAFEYLTRLKEILLYTGVSDCNMEEGSLRCDANVSVMLRLRRAAGVRHQGRGQKRQLASATSAPRSSTRSSARSPCSKKVAASCRSRASGTTPKAAPSPCAPRSRPTTTVTSPSPTFPPLIVGADWQKQIFAALPELPEAKRERLVAEYGISAQDAATLAADRAFADRFEAAARRAKSPRRVAAILLSEITMRLRAAGSSTSRSPPSPSTASSSPPTSPKPARSPRSSSNNSSTPASPKASDFAHIYSRDKPQQISDTSALEKHDRRGHRREPRPGRSVQGGKRTVAAFFVGQVMKLSKGQANPALLNELVVKKLDA